MPDHVVYQFLVSFDLKYMFKGCTSKNLWNSTHDFLKIEVLR